MSITVPAHVLGLCGLYSAPPVHPAAGANTGRRAFGREGGWDGVLWAGPRGQGRLLEEPGETACSRSRPRGRGQIQPEDRLQPGRSPPAPSRGGTSVQSRDSGTTAVPPAAPGAVQEPRCDTGRQVAARAPWFCVRRSPGGWGSSAPASRCSVMNHGNDYFGFRFPMRPGTALLTSAAPGGPLPTPHSVT